MSGAFSFLARREPHRALVARSIALLPVLAALAATSARTAEPARATLSVGATVISSCVVTTRTNPDAAVPASSSCRAVAPAAVVVERVAGSSPGGVLGSASGQVNRVTITF